MKILRNIIRKKPFCGVFITLCSFLLVFNTVFPEYIAARKTETAETTKDTTETTTADTAVKKDEKEGEKKDEKKEGEKDEKINADKTTPGSDPAKSAEEIKKEKEERDKIEKKVEWIETTLSFGIQKSRKDAINRMQLIKDESFKPRLVKLLTDIIENEIDVEVIIKAITIAGVLEAKETIPAITSKIDNESEDVQIAAVYGLKKLKADASKDKLVEKLKNQDMTKNSNLTLALLHTLGDFKAVELVKFASEKIDDTKTDKALRESLVLFLGQTESPEPKDFLIKLFKDDEENLTIRAYAVNSLAKLGIKEASPAINEVLKQIDTFPFKRRKKYFTLKIYSVSALVKLGNEQAYPRLLNSLKSNNASIRLRAVNLIKELKDKRTIDILKYKMKYDPNTKVRKAAEEALKEIEGDDPAAAETGDKPGEEAAPPNGDKPGKDVKPPNGDKPVPDKPVKKAEKANQS
ncbi:MAG: HEAT repeat domain-containing protein [bacterium]|nr:HEAT repeat domain-containing protein [bacterium]